MGGGGGGGGRENGACCNKNVNLTIKATFYTRLLNMYQPHYSYTKGGRCPVQSRTSSGWSKREADGWGWEKGLGVLGRPQCWNCWEAGRETTRAGEPETALSGARRTPWGRTRRWCSGGFSSASPWGRYAAAASRCPASRTPSGCHRGLGGPERMGLGN